MLTSSPPAAGPEQIGLVIQPEWIAPVIPRNTVYEQYSLVILDDKILDLLPNTEVKLKYPDWPIQRLPQQLLIPGFINTHGHMAMTLLRGYADDIPLMDWLNHHIWPVEGEFVDAKFVYDGTSLAIAEMIATGTTCGADSYFFPESSASAMVEAGFRGQIALPVIQFKNAWADGEADHLAKAMDVHDRLKHQPLLTTALGPHAPYTVTDDGFTEIRELSEQHQMPIHLHLHETADEVDQALQQDNKRPFQRIKDLGLLGPRLQCIHMTQLIDSEINALAETGSHVAHCPDSNLKLASGFCPVSKLLKAGVNIAIGTDGAASNNNLDMLGEIRNAALLAKAVSAQADSLTAFDALTMGTLNGAKLLGIDQRVGSLEPGKLADLVAVDFSAVNFQPVYHPVSQLIYAATGHQVSHVWINGRPKLKHGKHTDMDIPGILARTREWRDKIHKI